MRVALSIMLMQECCNFICQWENELGGVPIRIKHSSAVRYGEIFHADSCNKSYIYISSVTGRASLANNIM